MLFSAVVLERLQESGFSVGEKREGDAGRERRGEGGGLRERGRERRAPPFRGRGRDWGT